MLQLDKSITKMPKCKIDTAILLLRATEARALKTPKVVFWKLNLPPTSTNTVPVLCGTGTKFGEPASLDGPRLGRRDEQHGAAGEEAPRGRLLPEDSDEAQQLRCHCRQQVVFANFNP